MSLPLPAPSVEIVGSASEDGRASAVAPLLEAALVAALQGARPDRRAQLSAMNVEVTVTVRAGAPLRARAWLERATRTLAFASGEVFAEDGTRVASGAGVFELGGAG